MKFKKYLIIIAVFLCPLVYVLSCHHSARTKIDNGIVFNTKLSYYKLFEGDMVALIPAKNVEMLQLSSTLFTDYAEKQRLIKLPKGKQVILNGEGLPVFPEGTIIAKTFYYDTVVGKGRQIIETRLLILSHSKWSVATFRWNTAQNEAFLTNGGADIPINFINKNNEAIKISYRMPTKQQCGSCHGLNENILPIGPKARNLNVTIKRGGENINQLIYLMEKGVFKKTAIDTLTSLPSYHNLSLPIEQRARAYMEINCAHCHQPGALAGQTTLNLDYRTDLAQSGIRFNKSNIIVRTAEMGEFHMPKMGTTIIDKEGVALMRKYISQLP